MTSNGRFITLEGGEGTGKSTLIEGLRQALEARGRTVLVTREPGGTKLAEQIRNIALSPPKGEAWTPLAHALLMNTARDDHLTKLIRPALTTGTWVLCDRFADSTRAYQSIDGVSEEDLNTLERMIVGRTQPDLTLLLDGPPEALLARRQQRGGEADVFEGKDLDFHDRVRASFLDVARQDPGRVVVIDAMQSPEQVLKSALREVEDRLGGE
ncbi:MAG: dTMP kinase [Pseudomonadota bacterium]